MNFISIYFYNIKKIHFHLPVNFFFELTKFASLEKSQGIKIWLN